MKRAAPFVLVLLAALAVHWRALGVGFLSDEFYLPLLLRPEGVRWQQVLDDLTGPWLGVEGSGLLRPGITLHYCLDGFWFGVDPRGYHLANLLLHALNAALVFALARRLLRARPFAAALAGVLFAVHPATPEAVTWISGRVDTTTAFPFLLACLLAARGSGWCVLPAAAALLCKESAVVLPLLLPGVDALARRRAPRLRVVLPALLLLGGYALLRWLALGAQAGAGAGARNVPELILANTPGKLLALLAPEAWAGAPAWRPWLHAAAFGVLPGLWVLLGRAGRSRLLVAAAAVVLLVLPPFQVAIRDGYGGTRVLYLALVPLALVFGTALAGHARERLGLGLLRTGAAALLVALGVTLSDGRNQVFRANAQLVARQQAQVLAMAGDAQARGLFLADLFRESAGVIALRYDNAYLAFRRPFLPLDVPVYVGSNMAIEWLDLKAAYSDFVGLCLAQRAGARVGAFDPLGGPGGYFSLEPGARQEQVLGFDQLLPPGAVAEIREDGLHLPPSADWVRLEWRPLELQATAFEGVELLLRGHAEAPPVVCWFPTEFTAGKRPPSADPALLPEEMVLLEHWQCPCLPLSAEPPRMRWLAPVGNRAGWSMQVRFRQRTSMALLVPPHGQPLVLEDARLMPLLPPLEAPLLQDRAVALDQPVELPLPAGPGPLRIVLMTPMQVMEAFAEPGAASLRLPDPMQQNLRLIARLAPGTRIHYVVDLLARDKDRGTTLRRSGVGSFRVVR